MKYSIWWWRCDDVSKGSTQEYYVVLWMCSWGNSFSLAFQLSTFYFDVNMKNELMEGNGIKSRGKNRHRKREGRASSEPQCDGHTAIVCNGTKQPRLQTCRWKSAVKSDSHRRRRHLFHGYKERMINSGSEKNGRIYDVLKKLLEK